MMVGDPHLLISSETIMNEGLIRREIITLRIVSVYEQCYACLNGQTQWFLWLYTDWAVLWLCSFMALMYV